MRKLGIGIIVIIICIAGVAAYSASSPNSGDNSTTVITYGETTFNNQQYKSLVDSYFMNNNYGNIENMNYDVITASDVNAISQSISQQFYNSNQIYSSSLVDLGSGNDLTVNVDQSKITLVTEDMYKSALESAGITQGYVLVTSPVSATGESALAGVMSAYEYVTNTEIPTEVKEAANEEIYTTAEIVNNSNVSADDLTDVVEDVKEEVESQNITDQETIVNIINNVTVNYNIMLSQEDIEKLAESILQTQQVQDQANNYKQQIDSFIQDKTSGFSFEQIFNF